MTGLDLLYFNELYIARGENIRSGSTNFHANCRDISALPGSKVENLSNIGPEQRYALLLLKPTYPYRPYVT